MQLNRIQKQILSGGLNKWVPRLQAWLSQVWSSAPPAHKHTWVFTGTSSTEKDAKYLNVDFFLEHPYHLLIPINVTTNFTLSWLTQLPLGLNKLLWRGRGGGDCKPGKSENEKFTWRINIDINVRTCSKISSSEQRELKKKYICWGGPCGSFAWYRAQGWAQPIKRVTFHFFMKSI